MTHMDRIESSAILEALIVGYPRLDLQTETLAYWVEAIEESGADPCQALEIARRWARTHERFPTLADFLAVVTPRAYVEPVDDPDEFRTPPVVTRKMFGMWREALAVVDTKAARVSGGRGAAGHWHGGPDPCPMCGGIRPTLKGVAGGE